MNNKEIFSNNLSYYMKKKGVDRNKLCNDLDLRYTTVRDWIKGITYPRIGKIELLANYFNINKSDLIEPRKKFENISTLQEINDTSKQLQHDRQILVLDTAKNQLAEQTAEQNTVENSKNTVDEPITYHTYNYYDQPASAGTGQYLNDVQVEQIKLPVDINADFVIPIYGDSMEPDYSSGDYIFVKLSVDLSDGDIGVFEYYGDGYVKQLVIDDSGAFLHSLNSKYDDIPIDRDSDFRIIGEVVGKYSGK